jgi:hypothetical protein
LPKNDGTSDSQLDSFKLVKRFDLVLANMEDSPSYRLSHQLTVGSQIGNIVLNEPSVSPRHCTFVLKDDVVSLLDHGSVSGTFVNGQKVNPGKSIILEETDLIKVGELEVRISMRTERVEMSKEEPKPEPVPAEEIPEEKTDIKKIPSKKKSFFSFLQKKSGKAIKNHDLALSKVHAANTVMRIFAISGDLLIAYGLFIIFYPFDEYRIFISDLPQMTGDLLGIDWSGFWDALKVDYPAIEDISNEISNLSLSFVFFKPTFLNFILLRLISTFLFGVTLVEGLLGMKATGNLIWKRVGGVLRVLVGLFTGPLLVFDLPAIASKRTFKEFLTFTTISVPSKILSFFGIVLFMPLIVAFVMVAPLFQGLDVPETIMVSDNLDRRLKKVDTGSASEVVEEEKVHSEILRATIGYDKNIINLIPQISFAGQNKKILIKPEISFYHKELKRNVKLEIYKKFNLKELLGIGLRGNFFLFKKYPRLYEFLSTPDLPHSAFRGNINDADVKEFADEVVSFTKKSFLLNFENAFEFMQNETPLIKGLLDYKSSFLDLVEYKQFDQINYIKIGNAYFLKISYLKQKPFDLLIPILKSEGRIFKVQFDRTESLPAVSSKFYKFTLSSSDWLSADGTQSSSDTLSPLGVFDYLFKIDPKNNELDSEKSKALYGFYFEKSQQILNSNDEEELKVWKKSLADILRVFESLKFKIKPTLAITEPAIPETESPQVSQDDIQQKLIENLKMLKDAVESGDKSFFESI